MQNKHECDIILNNMPTKKNLPPDPNQPPLFSMEDLAPVPSEPGIAVSLNDRARHLLAALDLIGQARSRDGFVSATQPDSSHRPRIKSRYKSELDTVVHGAKNNREQFMFDAKWQFMFASGYMALKGAGLVSDEHIQDEARKEFNEFVDKFFFSKNASKERELFRKQLTNQQKPNVATKPTRKATRPSGDSTRPTSPVEVTPETSETKEVPSANPSYWANEARKALAEADSRRATSNPSATPPPPNRPDEGRVDRENAIWRRLEALRKSE